MLFGAIYTAMHSITDFFSGTGFWCWSEQCYIWCQNVEQILALDSM